MTAAAGFRWFDGSSAADLSVHTCEMSSARPSRTPVLVTQISAALYFSV